MRDGMTRQEALQRLALPSDADTAAVKHAYRRLARQLHPDAGGDPGEFRELQRAYERLVESPAVARARHRMPQRARPSRRFRDGHPPTRRFDDRAPDIEDIDWDGRVRGDGMTRLDPDTVARSLAREHPGPVYPLTARSRGPRALANRWVHLLADDLTATLQVRPARERGRVGYDVELWLRVWSRKQRRLVEAADLPDAWIRQRGSSSTTAIRTLPPSTDRRTTATLATRAIETALDRAGWPLASWYAPADRLL